MYKHEWCKTTSQILGYNYICLKCATCSSINYKEEKCKFESRSEVEKFKHTWGEDHICIKCKAKKFSVSHTFYKIGMWGRPFSRIEPCEYTDADWDVKEIIE